MKNSKTHHVTIPDESHRQRLDKVLSALLPEYSRARIQALIASGEVKYTETGMAESDAAHKVKAGEGYILTEPLPEPSHLAAQAIPLDIVYEDDDLLVINKPPGLTVHPGAGNPDGTLVNALLAHCGESLSGIGGVARPGIVHRIDKDTSGLLVVAKHDAAHVHLARQLEDRSLSRTYLAFVWGMPSPLSGTVTGNIGRSPKNRQKMAVVKHGGKAAVTHYSVIGDWWMVNGRRSRPTTNHPPPSTRHHPPSTIHQSPSTNHHPPITLLECRLETGRTHQIRVHMQHIGHPLVGDATYGGRRKSGKSLPPELAEAIAGFNRQALHAWKLRLIHPRTGEAMAFEAPMPGDMCELANILKM